MKRSIIYRTLTILALSLATLFGAVRQWETGDFLKELSEASRHIHGESTADHYCSHLVLGKHDCIHWTTFSIEGDPELAAELRLLRRTNDLPDPGAPSAGWASVSNRSPPMIPA